MDALPHPADPAPELDPVAAVWQSPELLGCVSSFLEPSHAAWSLIHVNKAAAAAASSDGTQPVPRAVSLRWLLGSGQLASPEGLAHARAMCYRLTLQQRVRFLCHCVASGCSMESLQGAVVAAGLSPPPREVLFAAAAAGRVEVCRWLVEALGCPGLHRLSCLCLLSAAGARAGPGPEVAKAALAWLEPAAREGWSAREVAVAVRGDIPAVQRLIDEQDGDDEYAYFMALSTPPRKGPNFARFDRLPSDFELRRITAQRDLEQPSPHRQPWSCLATTQAFYQEPHAAQAVFRLTEIPPEELTAFMLDTAAEAGNADAVRFLLSRGLRLRYRPPGVKAFAGLLDSDDDDDFFAEFADFGDADGLALGSNVEILQALHAAGCMGDPAARFKQGLEAGCLPVVSWLAETFGAEALGANILSYRTAARSGSVALLQALPGLLGPAVHGPYHGALGDAASSGCEQAVDWIASQNPSNWDISFLSATHNSDLSMMQRLRKLGCRWGRQDPKHLAEAASRVPASASALSWAMEPGVPASWEAAAAEARAEAKAQAEAEARAEAERARRRRPLEAAGVSGEAARNQRRRA
ncbi:hypothetical protein HYH03_018444 [Edaphochlamys debaryana]|uniref:Ankyrin repeat domain-containing protein n=1 Tax=Edaphochlamys debaryana TaxID=47281 RepID=A0A836BNA4_9CHLO|nr:hypothetical protein HYH03_018444 [Edaphochlamys debaryana]|eukprot:KAG2482637.1 hypothetical protein HYH03_018444 [Edaphochlamys debaryana]